ncbi:hypothetical protein [Clostridium grantii]|uniref:Uncharacterized protein n=1 Tax=Clostridium grantii DSM 8605 TaxID=1121316 RepID=A0A1M5RDM9_9CLOT|nr:hypothetical protein [Clostridium grantii]SHH23903.1 hypothetical protein SAMN02745207_00450 [Clostridium grantii DSM 8605]
MAKVTKAVLEEEINHLQNIIELQTNENIALQKEKDLILGDKDTVPKAEFDEVVKELENIRIQYDILKNQHEAQIEKLENKVKAYKDGDKYFIKRIDFIIEQNKALAHSIEIKNRELQEWEDMYRELKEKITELRADNIALIKKETVVKKHNERGAGRKSSIEQIQIDKILELHKQELSYSKIGEQVGLSKSYVFKLIKKHNNTNN